MEEKINELIEKYLTEHLQVSIVADKYSNRVDVQLLLNGKVICSEYDYVTQKQGL